MQKANPKKNLCKPQQQSRPGIESKMVPKPRTAPSVESKGGKLTNKIAFIIGGDSGIGKATALLCAKKGADIVVAYLNEHTDAQVVKREIEEKYKRKCLLIPGDISKERFCIASVKKAVKAFGRIDILVNNAGIHYETKTLLDVTTRHLLKNFATNIFSMFWITKEALPHLSKGSSIINITSVTAYREQRRFNRLFSY